MSQESTARRLYPQPAHVIVAKLAAFQHMAAAGFWQTDVVIQQIDAKTTRIGVRRVPRSGFVYHLVLLRLQVVQQAEGQTALKGRFRIEPWVWFATLPLFLLFLYSLVLMLTGALVVTLYTVGINAALAAYSAFMVWLTLRHIRELRAILQAAVETDTL